MNTRHFVTVGNRRVHYTRAGEGPPIAILHASPCSAKVSAPLQSVYAERFTAIAFDTPGFGLSDLLPLAQPETEDLADAFAATLTALGIEHCAVQGRHTGAQIAVEFAARHAARCALVVTDGFPMFTEEVKRGRPGDYLKSIVPSWDGTHLVWLWFRYREQHVFWPWNAHDAAHRADADVPGLDFLHRGVIELLEAGDGYRIGYATAYRHRGIAACADLTVPVAFGFRPGDSLFATRERLPKTAWSVEMPREWRAAARAERALFEQHPARGPVPPAPACAAIAGRTTTDYIGAAGAQMLVRSAGAGTKKTPIVLLHRLPGSCALYDDLVLRLGADGPTIALDLPGHGESDVRGEQSIEALADATLGALDALGVGAFHVVGHQGGCAVAVELAHRAGERVRRVVLDAPVALSPGERDVIGARWLEGVAPVAPSWEGVHLLRVWHMRRDMALWWPWFDRRRENARRGTLAIDPASLTAELRETMKQPASFVPAWQAVMRYPLVERLAAFGRPYSVMTAPNDVFAPCAATLASRGIHVREIEDGVEARARAIRAVLNA